MPPWKLEGARAWNIIFARAEVVSNCLPRFSFPARTRPSLRTASRSAQPARYATQVTETVPLRKQLKYEAKSKRAAGSNSASQPSGVTPKNVEDWELTVGIEIHAQLNTARKLFSRE